MVLQVLAWLHLFPLSAVTLVVHDVKWFLRHHYGFFSLLVQAGYSRVDPFDPAEVDSWLTAPGDAPATP